MPGRRCARCRHDQDEIRLREAPGGVVGAAPVARADDVTVALLGVGQGGGQAVVVQRRVVRRAFHRGGALTGAGERLHQVFVEGIEGRLVAGAQHGDGRDRHRPGHGPRCGLLEPVAQRVRQPEGHSAMLIENALEHGSRHAHQGGIATRPHVERSGFPREHPHLADRRGLAEHAQGFAVTKQFESTGGDQVQAIRIVSGAHHQIAALHPHQLRMLRRIRDAGVVERVEQGRRGNLQPPQMQERLGDDAGAHDGL